MHPIKTHFGIQEQLNNLLLMSIEIAKFLIIRFNNFQNLFELLLKIFHIMIFRNNLLCNKQKIDIIQHMDDDELEMLQMELMAVQQEKSNPLSERTVAEIMIKLQQEGFKFYPTTDGNEYVIPDHLDFQIIRFVQSRGKVPIGIIPQILNLNLDLVQSRINGICTKSTIIRNNQILISSDCLKSIILGIKEKLLIQGIVDLDEIAISNEFSMTFINKIVSDNLEELDAEVIGNQLVTKQYRRMKKRRVLGFLHAMSRPINIDTFLKYTGIEQANPHILIEELIKEGKLKGKCQNSYYIPNCFSENQKEMVMQFFENNGYLQFQVLQKNFLISKPQQWIIKNIKGDFLFFQSVCFTKAKLVNFQNQIESLLKEEGFIELSNVIPFQLTEAEMQKFLYEYCKVDKVQISEGYCFSSEWVDRCVNQFRDLVISNLFLKKPEQKGKKKGKKEARIQINPQELVESLFEAGLSGYSEAEDITQYLMPILLSRLEKLKQKCQKELAQSQGVITNAFLKYRKCKTILRTEESLQRTLNIIQKGKKKVGKWSDCDFGSTQVDKSGQNSLIYYDGILPRQWPPIENVQWKQVQLKKLLEQKEGVKSKWMKRSNLFEILECITKYNTLGKNLVSLPLNKIPGQDDQSPFICKFTISEKQTRYVLVDNRLPFLEEGLFCSSGIYGLIEKAYAKLRYCYKGLLGVGIQQLIFELTGRKVEKIEWLNKEEEVQKIRKALNEGLCILGIGEGTTDKKIKWKEEQTQLQCQKPYLIMMNGEKAKIWNRQELVCEVDEVSEILKKIYIL